MSNRHHVESLGMRGLSRSGWLVGTSGEDYFDDIN